MPETALPKLRSLNGIGSQASGAMLRKIVTAKVLLRRIEGGCLS